MIKTVNLQYLPQNISGPQNFCWENDPSNVQTPGLKIITPPLGIESGKLLLVVGVHTMAEASLQHVQDELDEIVNQIVKVQANSTAVEAAIAGKGTYRGYSGEDVFLKHNLWAVQKEMLKQLRRQERKLVKEKVQLLQTISPQQFTSGIGERHAWIASAGDCAATDCCSRNQLQQ